eukprot:40532-Pelagomonas_calceolata.AAC.1
MVSARPGVRDAGGAWSQLSAQFRIQKALAQSYKPQYVACQKTSDVLKTRHQKRMRNRTNVGVMMAGQGATGDVFAATEQFLKRRACIGCSNPGSRVWSCSYAHPHTCLLNTYLMYAHIHAHMQYADECACLFSTYASLQERRRMKEAQEEASRRRPYSPEQEMARR